jgi:hypothetical protein
MSCESVNGISPWLLRGRWALRGSLCLHLAGPGHSDMGQDTERKGKGGRVEVRNKSRKIGTKGKGMRY